MKTPELNRRNCRTSRIGDASSDKSARFLIHVRKRNPVGAGLLPGDFHGEKMSDVLIRALKKIAASGPADEPDEFEFSGFDDAEKFGSESASYFLAKIARDALCEAGFSV